MQTYPLTFTLKIEVRSPSGTIYPSGTTFTRKRGPSHHPERYNGPGHWYDFVGPHGYGFVFIPNKIFLKLNQREVNIRLAREQLIEDHIKAHKSFYVIPT